MFMKNVNAITNRVTLVFLMAIMIIGNIVLSPHIALWAEKKSITTSDEREVQKVSDDETINDEYKNDELFEGYLNKLFILIIVGLVILV